MSALSIAGLGRSFGGVRALDGVDLTVEPGTIHALLGSNGAGKSTLIKILAGVVAPDEGTISVGGAALPPGHSPQDAARAGLAFVHQDLGLVEELSVAENLALELGYERRRGLISQRATERRAASLGVASPGALVRTLEQDEKVMVAVTRAVSKGARVVVLDEVSSSLPAPEMERLAQSLRAAKREGVAYVYVTHRLEEVFALADRVTVLRDGRRVASAAVADLDHATLVEWIVGESAAAPAPAAVGQARPAGAGIAAAGRARAGGAAGFAAAREAPAGGADPAVALAAAGCAPAESARLCVRDLFGPGLAAPVSFDVRAGEVVGVCGLVGSGSRAVAALLGGAAPATGAATLDGRPLALGDPHRLAEAGCAHVPGDRVKDGAVADLSVRENLFLAGRRARRERAAAQELAERFDVRPRGVGERPLSTLSGGNQQKVIFARALRNRPSLLVLDDPTAGVDVGSRAQLHGFIREATERGAAVLLASTDFEEVAAQADRVLVMCHGRVAQEIERPSADALARAAYTEVPS